MKKISTFLNWIKKHKVAFSLIVTFSCAVFGLAAKVWPEPKKPVAPPVSVSTDNQSVTITPGASKADTSKPSISVTQEKNENSKNTIIDNKTTAPVDRSTKIYNAAPQRHVSKEDIELFKTIPKDVKVAIQMVNSDQNPEAIKYSEEIKKKLASMGYNVHPGLLKKIGTDNGKRIQVIQDEFPGWYLVMIYAD